MKTSRKHPPSTSSSHRGARDRARRRGTRLAPLEGTTLVVTDASKPSAAAVLDFMKVMVVVCLAYAVLGKRLPVGLAPGLLLLLTFSPLAGGVWLGMRGHRLPPSKYIEAGLTAGVIASTNLIFAVSEVRSLLEMSSRSAATLVLVMGVLLSVPALQAQVGAELGKFVEDLRRRKQAERTSSVSAVVGVVAESGWGRLIELCNALAPLTPFLKHVVTICLIILLALLAKL